MAIVADAARDTNIVFGEYNTTYQKGNDDAATPTPTWLTCGVVDPSVAETSIVGDTPVNNTADVWVPFIEYTYLTTTPATVRF